MRPKYVKQRKNARQRTRVLDDDHTCVLFRRQIITSYLHSTRQHHWEVPCQTCHIIHRFAASPSHHDSSPAHDNNNRILEKPAHTTPANDDTQYGAHLILVRSCTSFLGLDFDDLCLHSVVRKQPIHRHTPALPNTMQSTNGLIFNRHLHPAVRHTQHSLQTQQGKIRTRTFKLGSMMNPYVAMVSVNPAAPPPDRKLTNSTVQSGSLRNWSNSSSRFFPDK